MWATDGSKTLNESDCDNIDQVHKPKRAKLTHLVNRGDEISPVVLTPLGWIRLLQESAEAARRLGMTCPPLSDARK
jgi:hypothetical protein